MQMKINRFALGVSGILGLASANGAIAASVNAAPNVPATPAGPMRGTAPAPTDIEAIGRIVPEPVVLAGTGSGLPILSLYTNDFSMLALIRGDNAARFMPIGIELMAGELVGRLGRIEPRRGYGARDVVSSGGNSSVVLGRLGFQGALTSIDPAAAAPEGNRQLSRDKFSYKVSNLPGTVPEPERWAMLIIGFGLTGAAMRRRRRDTLARVRMGARVAS